MYARGSGIDLAESISSSTTLGSPIEVAPQGVAPDRYIQSNYDGISFLRSGMQKSGFSVREATDRPIETEGTVNQMMMRRIAASIL